MENEDIEMQSNSDEEIAVSERNMEEEGAVPRTSQASPRRYRGRGLNRTVRPGVRSLFVPNMPLHPGMAEGIRAWHERRASIRRSRNADSDERQANNTTHRGVMPFLSKILKRSGSYIYNIINPRICVLNAQQRKEYMFYEILTDDLWNENICIPTLYENVRNMARQQGVSLDFILEEARRESDTIPYGSMLHYAIFHRETLVAQRGDEPNSSSHNNIIRSPRHTTDNFNSEEITEADVHIYPFSRIKRVDLIFSNELIVNCERMLDSIDSSRVTNHMTYCLIIQQISAKAKYSKLTCEIFLNRWLKNYQKSPNWISEFIPFQVMLKSIYVNQYPTSNNTNLPPSEYVTVCHRTSIEDLFQRVEQHIPPEQIAMNNQILLNGQVTLSYEVPGSAERQAEAANEEGPLNQYILESFCERLHDFTGERLNPQSFNASRNIVDDINVLNDIINAANDNSVQTNNDNISANDVLNPTTDNVNPSNNTSNVNVNNENIDRDNGNVNSSSETADVIVLDTDNEDNTDVNPVNDNVNERGDSNSNQLSDDDPLEEPTKETDATQNNENKINMSIDDDDGQTCSICLESWTISGDHRLSALKCGHLFGNSCILRWMRQAPIQKRACPSCKSKAQLRDIRFIFARKVIAADNTEEEKLKQELQETKVKNARLETDILTMTTNQRMYAIKITELQKEISALKVRSNQAMTARQQLKNWRYIMHSNVEISRNSSCRVLAYNNRSKSLYVSLMSSNNLFPGYAMRKINCETWAMTKLLNLHPKAIRDASYSSTNDLLMSVALDKCIKIVQGANDLIITTIESQMPLWSCCWDFNNTNRIWVGGVGGVVCEYDIRQPKTAMSVTTSTDVSPVASLAAVPGGIVACRLNSITAYRKTSNAVETTPLPIEGTFTCIRSDPVTNDILVSCRSSSSHPRPRHIYCKSDEDNFSFVPYATFEGSSNLPLMSRSVLYSIDEDSYVSAYDGTDSGIGTWSVASGNRVHSLGANDFVVDMIPITDSSGSLVHLATLSQTRLRVCQVTPTN